MADRPERVRRLFAEAMERPAEGRSAWLSAACPDAGIREEVEALLRAHSERRGPVVDALEKIPPIGRIAEALVDGDPTGDAPAAETRRHADLVGTTVSRYEILQAVGSGGMGHVYRARDTVLDRLVALKFLPVELTRDPESRQRLLREARAASALDHPAICTVHEIGETADGRLFIVMAYVEGETLREKLKGRPLPLDEAIAIASQVAEGLAAAHARGIVHRDIKPANVMVTKAGQVKIVDFGLAKSRLTSLTRSGVTLGTVTCMSPEHVRGEAVDGRSDVWALGVLLFEMVAGRPPFTGESPEAVVHQILHEEPEPLTSLRSGVPLAFERVVAKALSKSPEARYQHVDELPVDLRAVATGRGVPGAAGPAATRRGRRWSWTAGLALGILAGAAASLMFAGHRAGGKAPRAPVSLSIPLPDGHRLSSWYQPLAISPDGSRLVYSTRGERGVQLYRRDLERLEAVPIPGTEGGRDPFFSPDSRSVGFYADGHLKRIDVHGGIAQVVCEAPRSAQGSSWGPEGDIVLSLGVTSGLARVPAAGGSPEPLTVPDVEAGEIGHTFPQHLPGGRDLLYSIWSAEGWRTAVLSVESGESEVVFSGGAAARYVPTGHLLFAQMSTALAAPGLLAVAFDPERRRVRGAPASVLNPPGLAGPNFDVSADGTLVYVAGGSPAWAGLQQNTLVWRDPSGGEAQALPQLGFFSNPRISPDGRRVAVSNFSERGTYDVWVHDLERDHSLPVSGRGSINNFPVWSPDGERLAFNSSRAPAGLYARSADGTGEAVPIVRRHRHPQLPGSWSPDGDELAFTQLDGAGAGDLLAVSAEGDVRPLLATAADESSPAFSPDGRWLAFVSDVSGRHEVYLRPSAGSASPRRVSSSGGREPVWSRDGRTIHYRRGAQILAVDVASAGRGEPRVVLSGRYATSAFGLPNYDVAPDGRFLLVEATEATVSTRLHVVAHWLQQLPGIVAGERPPIP